MQYTQSPKQCHTEGNTFKVSFWFVSFMCMGDRFSQGGPIFQNLTVQGDRSFRGTRPYVTGSYVCHLKTACCVVFFSAAYLKFGNITTHWIQQPHEYNDRFHNSIHVLHVLYRTTHTNTTTLRPIPTMYAYTMLLCYATFATL